MIDAARGHVSISGACIAPVVGLVAITPACGFVQPGWALLIGIIATCIVYSLLLHKRYMLFDDILDVAIVHGCGILILLILVSFRLVKIIFYLLLGGMAGAFMIGLFCEKSINKDAGANGALYGRPVQLWYQIAGILTAIGK